jgi:hypothetical protein
MSDKYDSNNGSKIYVLGKWGQFILGHFVYGDSPPIVKRLFREGKWALTDATVNDYARAIVEDLLTRRKIHIIDNEEIMKKYIIYISDKKTQDMVKSTQIFDAE